MKREKTYSTTCQACMREKWDWKDCTMRGQYIPIGDVCYCPTQVWWLIENVLLSGGVYPNQETEYGATPLVQHSLNLQADFVKVKEITGELKRRLERCGQAGINLVIKIACGDFYLDQDERAALNYCASGRKRRRQSFKRWVWEKEERRKKRQQELLKNG